MFYLGLVTVISGDMGRSQVRSAGAAAVTPLAVVWTYVLKDKIKRWSKAKKRKQWEKMWLPTSPYRCTAHALKSHTQTLATGTCTLPTSGWVKHWFFTVHLQAHNATVRARGETPMKRKQKEAVKLGRETWNNTGDRWWAETQPRSCGHCMHGSSCPQHAQDMLQDQDNSDRHCSF